MGRLFIAGKMLATGKSCYFSRDFGGNGWQSKKILRRKFDYRQKHPSNEISVTRWLNYLFNICPFTNEKKLPNSIKCTLGRFNIGQILNNQQEIAQRLQIVSPSGEISPNLVTLNELL